MRRLMFRKEDDRYAGISAPGWFVMFVESFSSYEVKVLVEDRSGFLHLVGIDDVRFVEQPGGSDAESRSAE